MRLSADQVRSIVDAIRALARQGAWLRLFG
jgi:hypothetical protein